MALLQLTIKTIRGLISKRTFFNYLSPVFIISFHHDYNANSALILENLSVNFNERSKHSRLPTQNCMEEGRHKTSKSAIINHSGCKTFEFFPSFLLLCKRLFPRH